MERASDRELDERAVAALAAAQFPDLAGQPVTRLGEGWDHELFRVGGDWILRFPKRAERAAWLTREIEILALAAGPLGPLVPAVERIGQPSQLFPYPFAGYRRLPGVAADRLAPARLPRLAAGIAAALSALHGIDPARVPPTPGGWESESWGELRAGLTAAAHLVRPLLGPDLLARAEPYLAGRLAEPRRGGRPRLIHNDICPDHLLADPRTGALTGLIDFTDAMAGDPVLDFTGLIGIGGYAFIREVTARYVLPLGEDFGAKLAWLARTLTLTWLAEAATSAPADIPKHQRWVARAFGGGWEHLGGGRPQARRRTNRGAGSRRDRGHGGR